MAHSSVNLGAINQLVHSPDGPVFRFLFSIGNRIRNLAVAYCNVDTGRLRSSISTAMTLEPSVKVGTDVEYALYVHEGWTRIAPIYPVTAKALSWVGPTGRVTVASVQTPASYEGNPFLRDAMVAVVGSL